MRFQAIVVPAPESNGDYEIATVYFNKKVVFSVETLQRQR